MTLSLHRHTAGSTTYPTDINSDNALIESNVNMLLSDVEALKAAAGVGADLDFRQNAPNLIINGGFDYWQRGTDERPDAWRIENDAVDFTVARESSEVKINTYSAKTVAVGQLTQVVTDEIRKATLPTTSFSVGVFALTDTDDKARIGLYNGTTTTWSDYHSGSDEWELLTASYYCAAGDPSALKVILDNAGATVYWNAAVIIRGNPNAGPIFIANDPVIERLRILSLYESGSTGIRGVGYLNNGDRELEMRIEFMSPKRSTPLIFIDDIGTGYDVYDYNVDRHGFNLKAAEIGGASGTNGFEIEDIAWTAEVYGT